MKPEEKLWMKYARRVMCGAPCETCCLLGHCDDQPKRVRRWPGYLGARYADGRVVLIGAIHSEKELFTKPIRDDLQPAVGVWIDSQCLSAQAGRAQVDRAYLAVVRSAYQASVEPWAGTRRPAHENWSVWGRFLFLLDKLGLDLKDVAFTNLTKCFTNGDITPFLKACLYQVDHNGRRLPDPHPYWSALQTLIEGLAPLAVFVQQSSDLTRRVIRRLKIPGQIWQFDNRTGALFQADGKPKILSSENWCLKAVIDSKKRRLSIQSRAARQRTFNRS